MVKGCTNNIFVDCIIDFSNKFWLKSRSLFIINNAYIKCLQFYVLYTMYNCTVLGLGFFRLSTTAGFGSATFSSENFGYGSTWKCIEIQNVKAWNWSIKLLIIGFRVKIYWITKCTRTGYFLPFFSSPLKKREEEKENKLAKPVFNSFFFRFLSMFTLIRDYREDYIKTWQ